MASKLKKINKKAFLDEKQMYVNEMGISLDMSKEEMEKKIIDWMRLEYYKMFDQVLKNNI